jgi:hypothetical protein
MILISRPQIQAWRRASSGALSHQGEDMLGSMLEMQQNLVELLEVPEGLEGIQEAVIGMMKESAETIECVHPGSRAWKEVDYDRADEEAIDVLLYLLEYFVLRGMDDNDVMNAYCRKVDIVTQRQVAKFAADKTEYIAQDEVLGKAKVEALVERLAQMGPISTFEVIANTPDEEIPFLLEALKSFYV